MFKKILSCFLVAIMIICAVPFSVSADTAEQTPVVLEGEGWIGISTAADFLKIGVDSAFPNNGNYYLQNDIDFGGKNDSANLVSTSFCGTLDGRGFALYNFSLKPDAYGMGVFKEIYSNKEVACVCNLNIGKPDAPINITANDVKNNVGFLADFDSYTNSKIPIQIDSVNVYGNMNITASGFVRAAGFIGYTRAASFVDCSFTGGINVTSSATASHDIGGIVATVEGYARGMVIKGCTVNATNGISSVGANSNIGGIVGNMQTSGYVTDCTVKGTVNSDGYVGGVFGTVKLSPQSAINNVAHLVAVTDCNIAATLTGTKENGAYGFQDKTGMEERIYIYNCTNAENTKSRDIGDFSGDFDPAYNYVWLIDDAADFGKIGNFDTYGDSQTYTYPTTGFYRLDGEKGVIDMGDTTRSSAVVTKDFNGVLDGNGNTLTNLNFNFNQDGGFFGNLANADDAIVMDINMGTEDDLVEYTSTGSWRGGVLGFYLGSANYALILDDVDVYAEVSVNNNSHGSFAIYGGFAGYADRTAFYDCSMNGSISIQNTNKRHVIGGFIGWGANHSITMHSCDNNADINLNITGSNSKDRAIAGGCFGALNCRAYFYKCNNFGDITNTTSAYTGDSDGAVATAMYAGSWASGSTMSVLYCANFGALTAADHAAACAFTVTGGDVMKVAHFENYGKITATENAGNASTLCKTTGTLKSLNCSTADGVITTDVKAAVRLSEPTGLRFTATVSDAAIQRLTSVYGEDAVSYGILIAPQVFVNRAKAHTHAALEAYSTAANGFNVDEGQKAYLDLEVDGYFKGQTGVIAGSLINIDPALYKTDMSAIAYVKIGDNYIYAETSTTKNIYDIACAALGDLGAKDTVDGEYVYNNKLEVGEKYFAGGELKTVGATDELYSCYTKAQRDTLNKIIADAN